MNWHTKFLRWISYMLIALGVYWTVPIKVNNVGDASTETSKKTSRQEKMTENLRKLWSVTLLLLFISLSIVYLKLLPCSKPPEGLSDFWWNLWVSCYIFAYVLQILCLSCNNHKTKSLIKEICMLSESKCNGVLFSDMHMIQYSGLLLIVSTAASTHSFIFYIFYVGETSNCYIILAPSLFMWCYTTIIDTTMYFLFWTIIAILIQSLEDMVANISKTNRRTNVMSQTSNSQVVERNEDVTLSCVENNLLIFEKEYLSLLDTADKTMNVIGVPFLINLVYNTIAMTLSLYHVITVSHTWLRVNHGAIFAWRILNMWFVVSVAGGFEQTVRDVEGSPVHALILPNVNIFQQGLCFCVCCMLKNIAP